MTRHVVGSAGTSWAYSPRPWRVGSARLAALLASSLKLLEQLDIRVPASGRHVMALRSLEAANTAAGDSRSIAPDTQGELRHAHRTAWETAVICVATFRSHGQRRGSGRSSVPFSPLQLHQLMKGPATYGHSRGVFWDTQFELLVAAQLVLGGLEVKSGEPDILFKYGHEWVGMACKRLTSLDEPQMRRNIAKARNQILRSGRRGWIALNLDSLFREVPIHGRRKELIDRFGRAFDEVQPIANELSQHSDVLGLLAYSHLSEWRTYAHRRPSLLIRAPFRWTFWEMPDPAPTMFFRDFQRGWSDRIHRAMEEIMSGDLRLVL